MTYWDMPPADDKLTVLTATLRTEFGQKSAEKLRNEQKRVPVAIVSRSGNLQEIKKQHINASIPTKQILAVARTARLFNQVFKINIVGQEEPVLATIATYYKTFVPDMPINIIFSEFVPGKKCKIRMPCFLENMDDSFAVKKGAYMQKITDEIPMFWTGGPHIPRGVVVDLLDAKPPMAFKVNRDTLPEGLTLRKPHHNYVVAFLKGTRRYYKQEEEEEKEA